MYLSPLHLFQAKLTHQARFSYLSGTHTEYRPVIWAALRVPGCPVVFTWYCELCVVRSENLSKPYYMASRLQTGREINICNVPFHCHARKHLKCDRRFVLWIHDVPLRSFLSSSAEKRRPEKLSKVPCSWPSKYKNAFQWDAYRRLVECIPACTAQGGVCPGVYPSMQWARHPPVDRQTPVKT